MTIGEQLDKLLEKLAGTPCHIKDSKVTIRASPNKFYFNLTVTTPPFYAFPFNNLGDFVVQNKEIYINYALYDDARETYRKIDLTIIIEREKV